MSPSFLYNFFLGRKKSGEGNSQSPSNLAPSSFSSHSSSLAAMEAPDTADIREETMESWSTLLEPGASEGGDLAELWKADLSQLLIGHMFAAGSRSRIYRGIYKDNAVAVKMVKALEQDDCELRALLEKQFTCEVSMLSRLSHPNIVQFIAACRKPPMYCIITEYMPQGTLRMYLHKKEPFSLSTGRILRLALDISRGMKYLHAQGVVHRDLKSDNLLLDAELRVKVADFGTSCLETRRRTSRGSNPGTYRWMAPEMIKNKACTKKVDVYSFGMVLWELTTALVPFQEMTPVQAAYAACEKNLRPALSEKCPAELNNLIKSCWSANPSRRPDFDDIVRTLERLDRCLRDGTPLSSSTVKLRNRISHLRSFTGCIAACSFVPVSA